MSFDKFNLIGIHGPLNGGKDTIANYLQDKYPQAFERYAFASPIKAACKIIFGFSDFQMEDRSLKEAIDPFWGFSPRKVFQLLGTEFGREMVRDDLWIKRAELEFSRAVDSGKGLIVTDVRFQNEANWIRSQPNSILIYVEVPNLKRDAKYDHASEAGITRSSTDCLIINDKSLGIKNLYQQLDNFNV